MVQGKQGVYTDFTCNNKPHTLFNSTHHQIYSRDYFLRSKYKGLLLYHKLGSGKTCTSILIADALISSKSIKRVFILSPGSLRSGWINEYCRVCGESRRRLPKYFTVITYNANIHKELSKLDFNDSLVIIDEVHNLINGVKNVSTNAYALYMKIMKSNCRVLALSGTPIFNHPLEWSILGNMLNPGAFPEILRGGEVDINRWNNDDVSDKSLQGIVSYYPGDPSFYPTVYYKDPIKIKMTEKQSSEYSKSYKNESLWRQIPPKQSLKLSNPKKYSQDFIKFVMATKYLKTRQISNFYYAKIEGVEVLPIVLETENDSINKKSLKMTREEKLELKRIEEEETKNFLKILLSDRNIALKFSPKFSALLINIVLHFNTKHVIYTFYKTYAGVNLIHQILKKCGIPSAIFSGDLSDKSRKKTLRDFNDVKNRDGKYIKVLLVTEAGAEGITILEANNIHILESSTREQRTSQAIGRVVRYKSHHNMPFERQYVNIWRYWSTLYTEENTTKKTGAIDELLYDIGVKNQDIINEFTQRLIDNSIEVKPQK
jgi:superfamily II DNA or RNA helicase